MDNKEQMESWRVALISVLCTLAGVVMVVFIYGVLSSGIIEVIKEDLIDDYCSSIPISEKREIKECMINEI